MRSRITDICRQCGRKFWIINYKYYTLCWRCRSKRALIDSTKSMKYMTEGNVYETNKEKLNKFIDDARKEWTHIEHLSTEKQEQILWKAVIDSFERKYGKLEDLERGDL